jgi:hypothetical protein
LVTGTWLETNGEGAQVRLSAKRRLTDRSQPNGGPETLRTRRFFALATGAADQIHPRFGLLASSAATTGEAILSKQEPQRADECMIISLFIDLENNTTAIGR